LLISFFPTGDRLGAFGHDTGYSPGLGESGIEGQDGQGSKNDTAHQVSPLIES
jgi:hypothetical protein